MSPRVGPPGPSCMSSAYVSGAKSGSSSRPAATRWRQKVSQSRSSGSSRYQAVRRSLWRAQSPRNVVLPNPASPITTATRPVAASSSQSLSRGRDSVSARRRGGWIRAPTIGKGFMPSKPARLPSSIAPGVPGPMPTLACSSCPTDRVDVAGKSGLSPLVAANDTDAGSAASTEDVGALLRSPCEPSLTAASRWSAAAVVADLGMPGMVPGAAHRRLIWARGVAPSPRTRSRS